MIDDGHHPQKTKRCGSTKKGGYGYKCSYRLGKLKQSPSAIMGAVTTDFNKYFTFSGCGPELKKDMECALRGPGGLMAGVRVMDVSGSSFTFKSLEGHPEGPNKLITFSIAVDSKGYTRLNVVTSGPATGWQSTTWGSRANRKAAYHLWYYFHTKIERNFAQ